MTWLGQYLIFSGALTPGTDRQGARSQGCLNGNTTWRYYAACAEESSFAALLRETGRGNEASKLEARANAIRAKHAEQNPAN